MELKNRDPIKEADKKPAMLRDEDKISFQRLVHLLPSTRRIEDWGTAVNGWAIGVVWISSGASDARTRVRILYRPPLIGYIPYLNGIQEP